MGYYAGVGRGRVFSVPVWSPSATAAPGDVDARLKRLVDLIISAVLLVFLLPALVLIWTLVRLSGPGPGLFWSRRVGRGGRIFLMPKFRSMRQGTPLVSREILPCAEEALTPFGHVLRRTSLDELPQLWSVFRGDMSLVGPRALIPNDIAMRERRRHPEILGLRPGITGLAQIRGRNALKPRAKARYDRFYVRKRDLRLDIAIICRTALVVLTARDIR